MKNFHSDDRSGGRGDRDSRRPAIMYQATCAECGKKCEVPFRPTGDRPIYCNDCFGKQGNSVSSRPGNKRFDRPSFGDRPKFQAVCDKCGKKCEVPFRPTGEKPIYCNDCFGHGDAGKTRHADSSADLLASINAKLDKLLAALLPAAAKPVEEKKIAAAPTAVKVAKEEIKLKKEKKAVGKSQPAEKKKAVKKKK